MIILNPCPKSYSHELDKAISPQDTVSNVLAKLKEVQLDILANTKRIDVGRLGIPVYLSECGQHAKQIMPTRKQMGKGASPIQAEASALMELMERFSFFSFWDELPHCETLTWSEAKQRFGASIIPIEHIIQSVEDDISKEGAEQILDLLPWQFFPCTDLSNMREIWAPLNWFKKLGEFNGTSAGNTEEESLLQGLSELIERHVCCIIDREQSICKTITQSSITDPVLQELLAAFHTQGINIILKDFSLNMPIPTVAAIAWDESTFPHKSEIVFTAGTASTPAKAAIRAVTEVAQLAGDFCTSACYEASGLSKFENLADIQWLLDGDNIDLASLPQVGADDILLELQSVIKGLHDLAYASYAISTMHPLLKVHSHYSFVPGLAFRERDKNQSLGLFVGRILAEEASVHEAEAGFTVLEKYYPNAHFIPFFKGILALRQEDYKTAHNFFALAEPLQPENDARGLAAFYAAYSLSLDGNWQDSVEFLDRAINYCKDMKEYWNLRGVAYFKLKDYTKAAHDFENVLHLDKGSTMDLANLGLCYKFLGNSEKACHFLEQALQIDPSLDFAKKHLEELRMLTNSARPINQE